MVPAVHRLQVLVDGQLELEPVGVDAGDGQGVSCLLRNLALRLGHSVSKRPALVGN